MTVSSVIEKKTAVKGGKKEKIIGTLAGWLIQLLGFTLRVKFAIPTHFDQLNGPVILVFWHAQIVPATTSQEELMAVVRKLNNDPAIHGILVQSPPPRHIDESAVVRAIDPRKDVDGFHPENVAKLALEDPGGFVPCTPAGAMRLLAAAGIDTNGAEAVVLGRSMIVGKPMALLLMAKNANATVTVAHSRSRDLPAICRRADILIAAVGRPEMVRADWVKDGCVVIDVGINRIADSNKKSGFRLTGDVAYDEVAPKCAAITPVPGGVGPMTIAMLMKNTLQAARQSR